MMNWRRFQLIEIPLTQGQVTVVDDTDADLAEFKWQAQYEPTINSYYAVRTVGTLHRTKIRLHRVILSRILGRELLSTELVDHIHHLTLDNRRSELRLANYSQNGGNRRTNINNTSGVKGVTLDKNSGSWKAQIQFRGAKRNIGYFSTVELAKEAYDRKALELFGEFTYKE